MAAGRDLYVSCSANHQPGFAVPLVRGRRESESSAHPAILDEGHPRQFAALNEVRRIDCAVPLL